MDNPKRQGKTTQIGFRITAGLRAEVEKRAMEENYASLSDYIIGLIRYDLAIRKPHTLTAPLSREDDTTQAQFERDILSAFKKGGNVKGSLLDHMVEQIFTDKIQAEIIGDFKSLLKQKLSQQVIKDSQQKSRRSKKK